MSLFEMAHLEVGAELQFRQGTTKILPEVPPARHLPVKFPVRIVQLDIDELFARADAMEKIVVERRIEQSRWSKFFAGCDCTWLYGGEANLAQAY
jgi:hypothetical protein